MEILRDTYLEINLKKLDKNLTLIKKMLGKNVALTAVVKANAYGHGLVKVSETIMKNGCTYLAVATLSEAIEIKKEHPYFPVLIMGYTPDRLLKYVVQYNIVPTIFQYRQAEIINNLSTKKMNIHIKIDTGFHRLGLIPNKDGLNEIKKISLLEHINMEGIFSHLALVNDKENEIQFNEFMSFLSELENCGINFKYKHIADSIASVDFPEYRLNMVRIGSLIYGMRGFHKDFLPVEQVLTWKARISQLHFVKKGEGVSYDYLWKAKKDSIIGTLPFGYADGYPRNMKDIGYVTINGQKANVIGVLCMDQCMVDLTEIPNISEGDEVIVYGSGKNEMSIQEASQLASTNKNEILSRLGTRPPRLYTNGEKL